MSTAAHTYERHTDFLATHYADEPNPPDFGDSRENWNAWDDFGDLFTAYTLDLAEQYIALGWKLLICASDKKKPINAWRNGSRTEFDSTALPNDRAKRRRFLRDFPATGDIELIKAWLQEWPDAQLAADYRESFVFPLDIDVKDDKDGHAVLDAIREKYADGKTYGAPLKFKTPSGGEHWLYAAPEGEAFQRIDFGHRTFGGGLDIKWNGYGVLPSGGNGRSWKEDVGTLSALPEWLESAILNIQNTNHQKQATTSDRSLDPAKSDVIPEGQRDDALTSIGGRLRQLGCSDEEIFSQLREVNRTRCLPKLDEDQVAKIANSVASYEEGPIPKTDVGNSDRFYRQHHRDIHHCEALSNQTWFEYDEKSGLWSKGGIAVARRRAMDTVRRMLTDAASIYDKGERDEALDWARKCESRQRLSAMTDLASARMQIQANSFDSDWNVLLTPNGVLVLRNDGSADIRKPKRHDLFTKITAAPFRSDSICPVWEGVLERVLPDPEIRAYFQRAVGYSLVGGQDAKSFFIVYGPKDSGKSTVLRSIYDALGGYAATTRLATFGIRADEGGNTPSLANLHGPRLIMAPEIPPQKEFATGLLKQWTGNDPVEAVRKFENPFTFLPAGKLWFVGNHPIRILYDDHAAWRRLHVIPFEQSIPMAEQDPKMLERIAPAAVLAWAVRGWKAYREAGGLNPPAQIREAVRGYREESDPLSDFLEERTVPDGEVTKGRLFDEYLRWARDREVRKTLSKKAFGQIVGARPGVEDNKRNGERFWRGLRLES